MTIADKKRILEKYGNLWKDIECYKDDIVKLQSAAEKVTSVLTGVSSSKKINDKMTFVDEIVVKKEKLQEMIVDAMSERDKIENAINKIENPLYRRVLRYKYINGSSFEEISFKENYNYKYISSAIYPKALDCIELDSMI